MCPCPPAPPQIGVVVVLWTCTGAFSVQLRSGSVWVWQCCHVLARVRMTFAALEGKGRELIPKAASCCSPAATPFPLVRRPPAQRPPSRAFANALYSRRVGSWTEAALVAQWCQPHSVLVCCQRNSAKPMITWCGANLTRLESILFMITAGVLFVVEWLS